LPLLTPIIKTIKMKNYLFLIMSICFISITSCKNETNDPQATLSKFFDAMAKKDITAARKLCTEESKSMLDMMEMGMKMDSSKTETNKYDKNKVEFGEAKIEGDKATINVKPKEGGESLNFYLKKEKDGWKVAFDKNSMMEMGMDKMKSEGIENADSIVKSMGELKDIDLQEIKKMGIDSMRKDIRKSLLKLDSVKRLLKK
jgi:hypothetical protein